MQASQTLRAFANFRALNGPADAEERDHLIRNLAQLYSYVSDRCDDEQVAQYDEVLCQLADIVEVDARRHVAGLLAPLERAPGSAVLKLANDVIEVARPLLEFSNVLSDDDLIEIVEQRSEAHRAAIAGRAQLARRVGEAIAQHGQDESLIALVRNATAELNRETIERLVRLAAENAELAGGLRSRAGIDSEGAVPQFPRSSAADAPAPVDTVASTVSRVQAVVYNRMKNRAGFSSEQWKLAWNQVKALADRQRFDVKALHRFTRFGYGHHAAAGLTMLLDVKPEILVKWLAMQDYVAITVAARAIRLPGEVFTSVISVLPWRDLPSRADIENVRVRFEALSEAEALEIFEVWRSHSFRKRHHAA